MFPIARALVRCCWLFGVVMSCCWLSSCKPAQHARDVKEVEKKLKQHGAIPEQSEQEDELLKWYTEANLTTYDSIGSKSPKWDANAREAIDRLDHANAHRDDVEEILDISTPAKKAIEAGCDDPLVQWIYARYGELIPEEKRIELFRDAAASVETSQYGDFLKFYASSDAYNWTPVNAAESETLRQMFFSQMTNHLTRFLQDKTIPVREVDDACHEYLKMIKPMPNNRKLYEQIEAPLLKNWPRSLACLIGGEFYIDYAWSARGTKYASEVTEVQWKGFHEGLELADKFLRQGVAANADEPRLFVELITLTAGNGGGLAQMKPWFDKAMEANPNNSEAGKKLIYYLLPRWYGSRDAMLQFGRDCLANEKWGGTVPLLLVEAHYTYNKFDGARDGSYWKKPDVWPDLKAFYEKFFKLNPNAAIGYHRYYARYADWCGQWPMLKEQLDLLGNKVNADFFDGQQGYDRMLKQLKNHLDSKN